MPALSVSDPFEYRGLSPDAYHARVAAQKAAVKARNAARAAHPLAGVYDDTSDAIKQASEAPVAVFRSWDFGNGHKEACFVVRTPKPGQTLERAIDCDIGATERGTGDLEANRAFAARRAKKQVRHLCKTMGVNSLWTLTYRTNLTDRNLALKHLDRFRRRVVALFGEWRYVAVLETQERGALHFHLATHALPSRIVQGGVKVKSWNVMRAIWRSVTGEHGGNFDEAKRTGRFSHSHKAFKTAGQIASYIAGYVAKDMLATGLNRKRYSASKGVDVPAPYKAMFAGELHLTELIELAYAAVGDNVTGAWFDSARGIFWIASDDAAPPGGPPPI